jgi:phage gp36-like protein
VSYATAADLIARFSAEEIAQRAAPEGVRVSGDLLKITISGGDRSAYSADEIAAADAALERLDDVLGDAAAYVDSRISVRFAAPITTDTGVRTLVRIECDIARFYLYDDAVDKDSVIQRRFDGARKDCDAIATGDMKLGEDPEPAAAPAASGAQVTGPGRVFGQTSLSDFMRRFNGC